MNVTAADYEFLSELLELRSGLDLGPDRHYLIESRLQPVAEKFGFKSISEIVGQLKRGVDFELRNAVIEAMTTNESLFFRDITPFNFVKDHFLPEFLKIHPHPPKIRVWSCACSSGQEPYSLAILFEEVKSHLGDFEYEIIASDLSEPILKKAKEGVYSVFEVQRGLPSHLLDKYFSPCPGGWKISDRLKNNIKFEKVNLIETLPNFGRFDLIFCRYVLIYFKNETKKSVVESLADFLEPHGYFFLGGTETLMGITSVFEKLDSFPFSIFRRHVAVRAEVKERA